MRRVSVRWSVCEIAAPAGAAEIRTPAAALIKKTLKVLTNELRLSSRLGPGMTISRVE